MQAATTTPGTPNLARWNQQADATTRILTRSSAAMQSAVSTGNMRDLAVGVAHGRSGVRNLTELAEHGPTWVGPALDVLAASLTRQLDAVDAARSGAARYGDIPFELVPTTVGVTNAGRSVLPIFARHSGS